jgi:hypothetical protein
VNTVRIRGILFVCVSICFFAARAQKIDANRAVVDEENWAWNDGTVTLNDGQILSGRLKLNTKTGLLGFESTAALNSFTAKSILGFDYFDADRDKRRRYISVKYDGADLKKTSSMI